MNPPDGNLVNANSVKSIYKYPVAFLALNSTTVIMLVQSYREKVLTNLLHHHRLGIYVASSCIYGIARALQYIQSLSFCSTFRHSTIIAVLFGLEQDLSSSHLASYCQLTSVVKLLWLLSAEGKGKSLLLSGQTRDGFAK